jgi:hypothetical protein
MCLLIFALELIKPSSMFPIFSVVEYGSERTKVSTAELNLAS